MRLPRTLPTTALATAFGLVALAGPALAGGAKTYHQSSTYHQTTGYQTTGNPNYVPRSPVYGVNAYGQPVNAYGQTQTAVPSSDALTVSGQMRGANLEPRPTYAEKVQQYQQYSETSQDMSASEDLSAAAATPSPTKTEQTASTSGSCSQDITNNVQDNSGGESGTRALNYLMAAGCTEYENFRPHGDQWAAEVNDNGVERTVVVNPDNGYIDVSS